MPKQFVTELDIVDMAERGVTSLDLSDDVVLTELAFEMARQLGVQLVGRGEVASPSAPLRPYLSQMPKTPDAPKPAAEPTPAPKTAAAAAIPGGAALGLPCAFCSGKDAIQPEALRQRVRKAAIAKMGDRMDVALIDTIIERVLNNIGLK
jgi:hypothetical protein